MKVDRAQVAQFAHQVWNRLPASVRIFLHNVPILRERALAFAPAGHFYSPLPDLKLVRQQHGDLFERRIHDIPGVDINHAGQMKLLNEFVPYYNELPFGDEPKDGLRYGFQNPFYSYSDGIFLYSMLRHLRPRRYLEIGSGYSSALALDVNERFFQHAMNITLVEPYPDRLLSLLRPGDRERIELLSVPLQEVPVSRFQALEPGDILFIDSSHVAKIGSDVNRLFFHILPLIPRGVYIHLHDIFYPFEYPEEWIYEGRAWNEAYFLRAFLQFNTAFEIAVFNTYLARKEPDYFKMNMPLCLKNPGGSIWLRRV